jgi:multiple sugar transport system substrate-binding protein
MTPPWVSHAWAVPSRDEDVVVTETADTTAPRPVNPVGPGTPLGQGMSRRTLLRAGGLWGAGLAAAPLLAACSSSSSGSGSSSKGGTYSMWSLSSTTALMKYFATKYQKVNPEFKLSITEVPAGASHRSKIITSAGAGKLPDIVDDTMAYGSDFATYGLFEPLSLPADYATKYSLYPRVWDWFNTKNIPGFDGGDYIFGSPYAISVYCPTYRVDLFEQAGLKFPGTWDELVSSGQKLTKAPSRYALAIPTSGDLIDEFHPFLMQAGAQYVNADLTQAFPNREAAYKGFQFYSDLVNKYKIAPAHTPDRFATDPSQNLAGGQVVMSTLQTVAIDALANTVKTDFGPDKKLYVGEFWAGPAGRQGYYNASGLMLKKGLKNPEPVIAYLAWLLEPEQQEEMFTKFRRPPMNTSVWSKFASDPLFKIYTDSVAISQRQGGFKGWKLAELAIDQAVERVVLDHDPVEQVVDQCATNILSALQNA